MNWRRGIERVYTVAWVAFASLGGWVAVEAARETTQRRALTQEFLHDHPRLTVEHLRTGVAEDSLRVWSVERFRTDPQSKPTIRTNGVDYSDVPYADAKALVDAGLATYVGRLEDESALREAERAVRDGQTGHPVSVYGFIVVVWLLVCWLAPSLLKNVVAWVAAGFSTAASRT